MFRHGQPATPAEHRAREREDYDTGNDNSSSSTRGLSPNGSFTSSSTHFSEGIPFNPDTPIGDSSALRPSVPEYVGALNVHPQSALARTVSALPPRMDPYGKGQSVNTGYPPPAPYREERAPLSEYQAPFRPGAPPARYWS